MNRQERTSSNDARSPHLVSTTTSSKKEELETIGNYPKYWSQVVLRCFQLAFMGWPHILWLVDGQARAITKSNKGNDKRLADSVLASIWRVVIDNTVAWESFLHSARWICLKILTAKVTWQTQNQRQAACFASLDVRHSCQPNGLHHEADSCFTEQHRSRRNLTRHWFKTEGILALNVCLGVGLWCVGSSSWAKSVAQQNKRYGTHVERTNNLDWRHHTGESCTRSVTEYFFGGCRRWVWVWGSGNPPQTQTPQFFLKNDKKRKKRKKDPPEGEGVGQTQTPN